MKKPSDSGNQHKFGIQFLKLIPRKQSLQSMFYGSLRIVISAIWPFLLYRTLKDIGTFSTSQIIINIGLVLLLLIVAAIATHRQSTINIQIIKAFTLDLLDRIWKKMNALDWLTFHGKNRVYYFDMLMVEAWRLRAGVAAILESLVVNSLIAGVLSIFIIFISWPLFIVCAGGLVLMGLGQYIATKKNRPLVKQFHGAWRDQHHWIAKSVDQYDLIKLNRAYEESVASNLENSTRFLNVNSALLHNQATWRNLNLLLSNIVRISVFVIGLYWVNTGLVGLDDLLLTLLVVSIVQSNLMQIASALGNFIEAQESLKTISTFFAMEDEKTDGDELPNHVPAIQNISIRDLHFDYEGKAAIENINIDLELGKIYLWRGSNGSGKSTVAHILLGLLKPKKGTLAINGKNMDWKELKKLRNRFAFLNQDAPIFMGSIKENALFGHPEPIEAWQTLQQSWLSVLLPKSSNGENRMVGERGEGLSGGEAKRVALIRELLRSSELLILDEPLNHLDEFAIDEIKREIVTLKSKTIIIIISHQTGFESIADEIKEF